MPAHRQTLNITSPNEHPTKNQLMNTQITTQNYSTLSFNLTKYKIKNVIIKTICIQP